MHALKLRNLDGEIGMTLPADLLGAANFAAGDTLRATMNEDGSLMLSRVDPVHEKGLEIARRGMKKFAPALAALAK